MEGERIKTFLNININVEYVPLVLHGQHLNGSQTRPTHEKAYLFYCVHRIGDTVLQINQSCR
jgi:hypothetical protein